jgi:hypothetical protein
LDSLDCNTLILESFASFPISEQEHNNSTVKKNTLNIN